MKQQIIKMNERIEELETLLRRACQILNELDVYFAYRNHTIRDTPRRVIRDFLATAENAENADL